MKIYNTLTRKKEELKTIEPGVVRIYACGPTVYNYIHIGNSRPACVFDVLRRYLEYIGYNVKFVQNFTDIDDKIIKKANEEGTDYLTIAERYIAEYKKDAEGLNIREATVHPRATENMNEIINIISDLEAKGYAYKAENGDVYFRTLNFDKYGKLSHQPLEELEAGARISVGELKENPMDFAVWKAAKSGEPMWESPWSMGRPGWHIECSAMARKYLGTTIDIHCGGQDLIFPHHENEIAQSECCNGVDFANYWMHNGYINVDNRKMSKSLNNFFTVRDVAKTYGYDTIRYLMLASHYRSPINYSTDIMEQCKSALERLRNCRSNLQFIIDNATAELTDAEKARINEMNSYRKKFKEAMDDDLNTANAISVIFDIARDINTSVNDTSSKEFAQGCADLFDELCDVLGIVVIEKKQSLAEEVEKLIEQRTQARKNKDFATADMIRDKLKEMNIVLEDTPMGVKWHQI
ncbi:MAG: cysteine--tRNA ligase [Clostridia bacterium]|nr:cysteine--tRNA ligase [Clostridia bacterium]